MLTISVKSFGHKKIAANEQALCRLGISYSVCPLPLLIENIKLNLRTKVESYLSSQSHSLALQLAQ